MREESKTLTSKLKVPESRSPARKTAWSKRQVLILLTYGSWGSSPRIYVFALDGNLQLKEAQELLFQSKYSRIPVYDGTLDNITGVLYKTKALTELAKDRSDVRLRDIAHPPLFVPAGKTADDLMKQFQQEKRHMGIVVNEFGGVMGLVTLEDLVEEVVGEIVDETDITEELIKRIGKNQILCTAERKSEK